ncbi:MAG: hypothetical protein WBA68_07880 [Alteraurantiacibacter sp.]
MIRADTKADDLAARMARRARILALAHGENRRRRDAARWREARLLWPLSQGEGR